MAAYTVKKISGKRWDIFKDQALLIPNFTVLTLANKTAAVLTSEVAGARAPVEPPAPLPPPPPTPPPVVGHTVFQKILGPMLPAATTNTLGPTAQKWLSDFVEWAERHWLSAGTDWSQVDYYDRAEVYYAMHEVTRNPVYLERANACAVDYRDKYIIANNYSSSLHWSMMKGIALHYLATGDEASKFAVGQVACGVGTVKVAWGTGLSVYAQSIKDKSSDGRTCARLLENSMLADMLQANTPGVPGAFAPPAEGWTANSAQVVDLILGAQEADGAFRFGFESYHAKPFMMGLINTALIDYYTNYNTHNAPILASIKKSCDFLWDKTWDAATQSFKYLEAPSPTEGDGPAPDLTNLIVGGFGFVYAVTGDPLYKERGDAVFAGGVNGAYLPGQKQFNQAYTASYNYLALTHPELTTVTGDRARDWLNS